MSGQFPPIEPYDSGMLDRGDGYKVYWECCGSRSLLAMTPEGQTIEAASVGRSGAVCPVHKSNVREGFLTAVALERMRVSRIAAAQLQATRLESEPLNEALRACPQN
jgi:hypothetical protein